jgi:hypothetical protein
VTDLPRFHSGRLGPLDFQTLNEMMRRLDALRPLVETASVKNGSEFSTLGDVLIVQAAETHPAEYPGRFAWNQVIVRGESTPTIPVDGEPDTIATEVDDDWETIEENAQYRYGTVVNEEGDKEIESDSYAICIDPTFAGGYAVLFAIRRTDGSRCYLLVPIVAGEVTAGITVSLLRISSFTGESFLNNDGGGGEPIRALVYTASPIAVQNEETYTSGSSVTLLDFGQSPDENVNKPTTVPDGAVLTSRTLDPGSIVLARKIGDQPLYVSSTITHYDVTCR